MPVDLTTIQLPPAVIEALEQQIADFHNFQYSGGGVQQLSGIADSFGLIQAGEIRLGNNALPGSGFSGLRLGYPAIETTEGSFHLAGFSNDIVQIGLDADDGTLGWGYSDGVSPFPSPAGFSGILDASGLRILYSLDPTIVFLPGGGAMPLGQRAISLTDDLDPSTGNIISSWGAIHDSANDITYVSLVSEALDDTASSLIYKTIQAINGGATEDKNSQLRISALYTQQATPRLYTGAQIDMVADGSNERSSISLTTLDDAASKGADLELLPWLFAKISTGTNIPFAINQHQEIEEISAPTGAPAAGKKWLYTSAENDLIVEDESGTQFNILPGKETVWIPSGSMSPTVSNGCADFALVELTAGRPNVGGLKFDKDADEHAQFSWAFPKRWDLGTLTFQVYWTNASAVTTGIAWALQAVAIADDNPIDTAFGTPIVITDDSLNSAHDQMITSESAALTIAGSPAESEMIYFDVFRDVSDANDDLAEDATLLGIRVFWTANTGNDN